MVALRKRTVDFMTVEEFLDWDSGDESGRAWQLVEGIPKAMAPTTQPHGAVHAELMRLIGNHLVETGRECHVIVEPGVVPRVRAATNLRIPDFAVVCGPPEAARLLEDPVLLVEVLSRSNASQTYANIWTYTTIPSVREILVISSTAIKADLLRRLPDGNWPEKPETVGAADVLRLDSLGFAVPLQAAYRTSGPSA